MTEPSKLLTACSLFMASLFAYSASVQLNDQGNPSYLKSHLFTVSFAHHVLSNLSNPIFSLDFSFFSFLCGCQDWYFWLPLYASASLVNLFSNTYKSKTVRRIAKLAFWLGLFLFLKVVVEDYLHGLAGFWSLDLSQRVVREKLGSGLVVIAMFLQLVVSRGVNDPLRREKVKVARPAFYGMVVLVTLSFGLSLAFFMSC